MDSCQSPCQCTESGEWQCWKIAECETSAECNDVTFASGSEWEDALGRDCEWYGAEPLRCILYGTVADNELGLTAQQTCCACEGGLLPLTSTQTSNGVDMTPIAYGAGAAAGVLLIALIVTCTCLCTKKRELDEVMKEYAEMGAI